MPGAVPLALLRDESCYRTFGAHGSRIGCGFWTARRAHAEVDVTYPYFALGWVLRGTCRYADASGERRLGAGDVYLRFPRWRHSTVYDDRHYAECWLDLGGELARWPELAALGDRSRPVLSPGVDLTLVRRVDRALAELRAAPESRVGACAIELAAITAELARLDRRAQPDPHEALIEQARALLEQGPAPRWRLERLARAHGLGYERLRKLFAARVGCPPAAYAARRRLDRARELLLSTGLPVREIAQRVGFASAATFSLRFRAHVGASPGRFRRGGAAADDQTR